MVSTDTRTATRARAKTLLRNSVWDLYVAIASEYGADDDFIHDHGDQLERILRCALDQRRLDGVAIVVVDERDYVVDPWRIDVIDEGSQVRLSEPDLRAVCREIRHHGTDGTAVLAFPIVDGVDAWSLPATGTKIDTYGGAGLQAEVLHGR